MLMLCAALLLHSASRGDPLKDAIQTLTRAPGWKVSHMVVHYGGGTRTMETWVRLPNAMRRELREGSALTEVTVQNGKEAWVYRPAYKEAAHGMGNVFRPDAGSVGGVWGPQNELKRLQGEARRMGGITVRQRRQVEPDGTPVRVFTVDIDALKYYRGDPRMAGATTVRHVLYLDARTGRLRRWEDPVSRDVYEIDGYDQPLPETLFTWQAPPGVRVVEHRDWFQARKDSKIAAASRNGWQITVHSVDVSASGDVYLTVTGASATVKKVRWPTYGLTLTDDRGRVYVQFSCRMGKDTPDAMVLLGFVPVEPRQKRDPFPQRVTARLLPDLLALTSPEEARQAAVVVRGLPAPAPASWDELPLSLLNAIEGGPKGDEEWESMARDRARRAYRESVQPQ